MVSRIPLVVCIREMQAISKNLLSELEGLNFSESLVNTLVNMDRNLEELAVELGDNRVGRGASVKRIARICSQVKSACGQLFKLRSSEYMHGLSQRLFEISKALSDVNNVDAVYSGVVLADSELLGFGRNANFIFSEDPDAGDYGSAELKEKLQKAEAKAALLAQDIATLEVRMQEEVKKILGNYERAAQEIELKSGEINNVLGKLSGRAIAGDYEKSAAGEKRMADYLRLGSLFFMAVIACALIYTFFETANAEFDWRKSIFRISLTFLLSVPAAYLARESARHREQQYHHLQTSLDLKAIPPFLATLSEDEQNRFKLDIANRIFGARETKLVTDPYPINTQEIIMALITKVEDFSSSQKAKSKQGES